MSYFEYDTHDKRYFETPRDACANCERTDAVLFDFRTDDDRQLRMCDDCCAEERRLELQADHLATAPSCDRRAMIIDLAETTRGLVNQLQAHDMSCPACSLTRKTAAIAVLCEGEAAA